MLIARGVWDDGFAARNVQYWYYLGGLGDVFEELESVSGGRGETCTKF